MMRRHAPPPAARRALALAACAVVAAISAGGQEVPPAVAGVPENRPPVVLRGGMFVVPPQLLGRDREPELGVRVEIDERGRPRVVEVFDIQPSTESDAGIVDAVRQEILTWRYAPRLEEGRPVPATLTWRVRFHGSGADVDATSVSAPVAPRDLGDVEEAREAYARGILELPEQQRIKLLDELATQAIGWLDTETTQRASTPHFIVYTDGRGKDVAQTVANNLEAVLHTLTDSFGTEVPLYPEKYKLVAVVYSREDQFAKLRSGVFNYDWTAGFYHPAGLLSFHREVATPGRLLSLLIHEATHAFLDRHVVRPGARIPTWLNEGFADYIGNSRVRKGGLQLGEIAPRELFLTMYGVTAAQTGEALDLQFLKRSLRRGEAPSAENILNARSTGFYGGNEEEIRLHYAFAWLLVHYLRHGDPSWSGDPFTELLLYASEGYPVESILRQRYGLASQALDQGFREYVHKL